MRQLDPTELKRLHRSWRRQPASRLALVLEQLHSPFNVGSILRTAASLRVERVWFVGETPSPDHPQAAKSALGTARYVDCVRSAAIGDALAAARDEGFHLVGLEQADKALPLPLLPVEGPTCIVVGHESRGVSPAALAACDAVTFIPQLGRVGSLNVATATAIALYEMRRRDWVDGEAGPPASTP